MLIDYYSTIIHILTSYKTPPLQIILTLPKGSNGTVPFQEKNPQTDLIDLFSTLDSNEIFHISKLNNL